jgi:NADH:ubiquinone oxidoreductase subunit 3 (subunit A)
MTPLAAYLLLFLAVGVGFIFVHLVAGKLIRPSKKNPEKDTIYECGEPTIGSAWIQFDLRFYVVALLFVIFDVEVAFFFPWAEVFGKANAVRNTPTPKTPEEHHAFATKVLDLAAPAGGRGDRQRDFWEGVLALGERPGLIDDARRVRDVIEKVHQEQLAEAERAAAVAAKLPEDVQKQLQQAMIPPIAGGVRMAMPPGPEMLKRELDERANQVKEILEGTSLAGLRDLDANEIVLVYRPGVQNLLAKHAPKALESARQLVQRQAAEVRAAAAAFFAAAPREQQRALGIISLSTVENLGTVRVSEARNAATTLAWQAFFEILVFFGVLLVGFAYLWRRGDLAWVRSTAAESMPPVEEKRAAKELEAVGKGS